MEGRSSKGGKEEKALNAKKKITDGKRNTGTNVE